MKLRKGRHNWRSSRSSCALGLAVLLLAGSSQAFAQESEVSEELDAEDVEVDVATDAAEAVEDAAEAVEDAAEAVEDSAEDAIQQAEVLATDNAELSADVEPPADIENITITGYGSALASGLNQRRMAVTTRESIFAGDLAKIPDLNLAEAIQRVPGVTISYEGGEGRQITLRGLGPEFTQATLNGMVVPASTDGLDSSGGSNGGRAFDFNVFASELFNRIDINKSPRPSIEEGGLAGTVDLYSPRPLDNPGYHIAVTNKGGYNLLTETADPRVAALGSATFLDNIFGVSASFAYTRRTVRQEGFGSVRYEQFDVDRSEDGVDQVWMPRIPRLDFFGNEQHRLGVTATAQFKPTKAFDITVDFLHSELSNERESYNVGAQFRNVFNGDDDYLPIGVESLTRNSQGAAVAGQFSNVQLRTESRLQESNTDFNQIVANFNLVVTEAITLKGIAGYASSDALAKQFRFNLDSKVDSSAGPGPGQDFGFDFSDNANFPVLNFGDFDLTDPNSYEYGPRTIVGGRIFRENITTGLDFNWSEGLTALNAGVRYNDRKVENTRLDAANINREGDNVISGTTRLFPAGNFGKGFAPNGTPTSFLVADLAGSLAAYEVGGFETSRSAPQNNFVVQEQILSAFIELNAEADLLGRPLRVNGGVRVARTEQTSEGFGRERVEDSETLNVIPIEFNNTYVTALPSANFVWEALDQVQLRLGISRSMTRPGLGSLNPGYNVSTLNRTYSTGNAELDPILSTNVDAAFEWFFTDSSMFAVAFFYKDIDSFIATQTTTRFLDEEADADIVARIRADPNYQGNQQDPVTGGTYDIQGPINNDGAELSGVEVALQTTFFFLPGFFSNFGVQLNYTFVDSETQYGFGDSAVVSSLIGLSQHSYNGTLYYEGGAFGGRVSVNGRSDFVSRVPGRNGNDEERTDEFVNVASLLYWDILQDVGPLDNLSLTLEGFNLTDQAERLYTTGNNSQDFVREYNHTGRQFFLGLRARI